MTDGEDRTSRNNEAAIRPETDRLLCDVMLGTLAVYLRLCDYDTAYAGDRGVEADDRLVAIADEEDRRLCTRDVELARRVPGSLRLTERDVERQLSELRERGVELTVAETPTYCGRCNGRLIAVSPDADTPEYAPDPAAVDCWRCRVCDQVFWKGSHWERMRETIESS
jgi:uncharacterized protein with PIN domain